jgi:hypothetical protein
MKESSRGFAGEGTFAALRQRDLATTGRSAVLRGIGFSVEEHLNYQHKGEKTEDSQIHIIDGLRMISI